MARLKTRPGKLSDLARHVILPSGIVATGWPAVRDKCAEFGDTFDEWQDGAGRAILAKRADGIYASTVGGVVLSIPRQVAKTFLVGRIVVALCILFPNMTVLWTAHRTRTTTRTFQSMQAFVKRKKVAPYLAPNGIRTANGEQEIKFRNGSVILFGAREQGFGRGFDEVDIEVFDEAQILTDKALEDMVAATNQSRHPHGALLFFMGTPPRPTDPGEAFTYKRNKALSGQSEDMVYVEFSADRDAELDDRKQWAKANPSYPHRTPLESMLRLRENLPSDDSWRREALGIWDDVSNELTMPNWPACSVDDFALEPVGAVGLAVSHDRAWGAIGAADLRDGVMHVGTVARERGTHWLADEARRLYKTYGCPIIVDGRGPAADLIDNLQDAGAWVVVASTSDYLDGCAEMFDAVAGHKVAHMAGDEELNQSVSGAGQRTVGDRWAWSRRKSTNDVSVLEAVTLAAWGVNYIGGGVLLA